MLKSLLIVIVCVVLSIWLALNPLTPDAPWWMWALRYFIAMGGAAIIAYAIFKEE